MSLHPRGGGVHLSPRGAKRELGGGKLSGQGSVGKGRKARSLRMMIPPRPPLLSKPRHGGQN